MISKEERNDFIITTLCEDLAKINLYPDKQKLKENLNLEISHSKNFIKKNPATCISGFSH